MVSWSGVVWVAALVVLWGGVTKVGDPEPTARAFVALRPRWSRPKRRAATRALALTEIVLGMAVVVIGGRVLPGLLATLFVAFAVVVAVLARQSADSCGCFGGSDAPPGPVQIGVDLAAAALCVAGSITGVDSAWDAASAHPMLIVPVGSMVGLAAWLTVRASTDGAVLADAMVGMRA